MDENVTRNLLRKAISLKTTIINKHNIKNFSNQTPFIQYGLYNYDKFATTRIQCFNTQLFVTDHLKSEGNKCFKNKNYEQALDLYYQSLSIFRFVIPRNSNWKQLGINDDDLSYCQSTGKNDNESKKITQSLLNIYQNISIAYQKLKQYKYCIEACNECLAIDASNVKAYYRRSKALSENSNFTLDDLKNAYEDMKKASEISPEEIWLQQDCEKLQRVITKHGQNKQSFYNGLIDMASPVHTIPVYTINPEKNDQKSEVSSGVTQGKEFHIHDHNKFLQYNCHKETTKIRYCNDPKTQIEDLPKNVQENLNHIQDCIVNASIKEHQMNGLSGVPKMPFSLFLVPKTKEELEKEEKEQQSKQEAKDDTSKTNMTDVFHEVFPNQIQKRQSCPYELDFPRNQQPENHQHHSSTTATAFNNNMNNIVINDDKTRSSVKDIQNEQNPKENHEKKELKQFEIVVEKKELKKEKYEVVFGPHNDPALLGKNEKTDPVKPVPMIGPLNDPELLVRKINNDKKIDLIENASSSSIDPLKNSSPPTKPIPHPKHHRKMPIYKKKSSKKKRDLDNTLHSHTKNPKNVTKIQKESIKKIDLNQIKNNEVIKQNSSHLIRHLASLNDGFEMDFSHALIIAADILYYNFLCFLYLIMIASVLILFMYLNDLENNGFTQSQQL